LRYAQSVRYIRTLADTFGFEVEHMQEEGLREERKVAVTGVFVWLRKARTHLPS
jgi:predicted TPR repeat methyltransferase